MVSKVNTDYTRYSSWGRTRQPKNLNGASSTAQVTVGTGVGTETAVPSTVSHGHATENQRFLHVLIKDAARTNGTGIVIWAYSHAFGTWGKLTQANGTAAEIKTASTAAETHVFEISGVDRVYFQSATVSGGNDAWSNGNDQLFAACSTF